MGEWIGDHYYYDADDVKVISEWGHLNDTYGWEYRIVEQLDVYVGRHALKKMGINPTDEQIAMYLNGEELF